MQRSVLSLLVLSMMVWVSCTRISTSDFPTSGGGSALESWERATFIRVINRIPNSIVKVEFKADKSFVGVRKTWGSDNKWSQSAIDDTALVVSPHEFGLYMPYNIYMHGNSVNNWHQDMTISLYDATGTICLEQIQVRYSSTAEARLGEVSFASKWGGDYLYKFVFRSWVDNYLISQTPDGSGATSKWCCFGELVIER